MASNLNKIGRHIRRKRQGQTVFHRAQQLVAGGVLARPVWYDFAARNPSPHHFAGTVERSNNSKAVYPEAILMPRILAKHELLKLESARIKTGYQPIAWRMAGAQWKLMKEQALTEDQALKQVEIQFMPDIQRYERAVAALFPEVRNHTAQSLQAAMRRRELADLKARYDKKQAGELLKAPWDAGYRESMSAKQTFDASTADMIQEMGLDFATPGGTVPRQSTHQQYFKNSTEQPIIPLRPIPTSSSSTSSTTSNPADPSSSSPDSTSTSTLAESSSINNLAKVAATDYNNNDEIRKKRKEAS